jgi:membrane protease YdiL (CAAX protease family)
VLSEKPWKLELILRLGLRLFICQILGVVAATVIQAATGGVAGSTSLFYLLACGTVVSCAVCFVLARKPWWNSEGLTRSFTFLLCSLCVALMLTAVMQYYVAFPVAAAPVWRIVTAALCFQGAAILFVGLFVREHGLNWSDGFGFTNQWPHAVLLGVLLALFLPVGWGLQQLSAQFMTRVDVEPVEQQAVQSLRSSQGWLGRALLAVVAIGLAPLAEESLFRGILYPAVKQAGFRRMALWGTSALFAVIHGNLATLLPLFVLSVALTLLYEWSNNLLAPIVAHAFFNAINFLRLFVGEWLGG